MVRRYRALCLAAITVGLLSACGGGGSSSGTSALPSAPTTTTPSPGPTPTPNSGIVLTPPTITLTAPNTYVSFTASQTGNTTFTASFTCNNKSTLSLQSGTNPGDFRIEIFGTPIVKTDACLVTVLGANNLSAVETVNVSVP